MSYVCYTYIYSVAVCLQVLGKDCYRIYVASCKLITEAPDFDLDSINEVGLIKSVCIYLFKVINQKIGWR